MQILATGTHCERCQRSCRHRICHGHHWWSCCLVDDLMRLEGCWLQARTCCQFGRCFSLHASSMLCQSPKSHRLCSSCERTWLYHHRWCRTPPQYTHLSLRTCQFGRHTCWVTSSLRGSRRWALSLSWSMGCQGPWLLCSHWKCLWMPSLLWWRCFAIDSEMAIKLIQLSFIADLPH